MARAFGKVFLAAVCVALAAGCGGGGQDTPKATVEKMFKALKDGDKAAFAACYDATPEYLPWVNATAGLSQAARQLQDTCVKKFGEAESRPFRSPYDKPTPVDEAEVKVDGDRAEVLLPRMPGPLRLVKKGGVWKVNAAEQYADLKGARLEWAVKTMDATADAMRTATAEAEKPGATPESVRAKMLEKMTKVMQELMPQGTGVNPPE
jgi:hypothetical protein